MPPAMWRGRSGRRFSISGGGVQSGHSRLAMMVLVPRPFEAGTTDADAVFQRLMIGQHEVEAALGRRDHDGAGRVGPS